MFGIGKPKAVTKSVTVWGAITSIYGSISALMGNPLLTGALFTLIGIDPAVGMKVNAVATLVGAGVALYGRVRKNGGQPLVLTEPEKSLIERYVKNPEKARALEQLAESGALSQVLESLPLDQLLGKVLPPAQPAQ